MLFSYLYSLARKNNVKNNNIKYPHAFQPSNHIERMNPPQSFHH